MTTKKINIKEPQTDREWEGYFHCRWNTLRKPWGHPKGSEQTDDEEQCYHVMASCGKTVCGVGRIQEVEENCWQIRFMGVENDWQGKQIGKRLVHYLIQLARSKSAKVIMLHAREPAVEFYERCGFKVVKKSYLLWDTIQHYEMRYLC
jgi:N-acetylglutamate synthase-like GNAT family acetyltransferase